MIVKQIQDDLSSLSNSEKASFFPKFFKAGKGEYAEGDRFIGVTVPNQRLIAKKYFKQVSLSDILELLKSPIHEHRQTSLMMLVSKYEKEKNEAGRKEIVDFYLDNTNYVNNWDMVDGSARILGWYLEDKDRRLLYELARSDNLWEQRIAIVATQMFIRKGDIKDTLKLSKILLSHKHDLIHKAVGWMLREAWDKEPAKVEEFLRENYSQMPRTALRYAIEKFSQLDKQKYLKGEFN